LSSELAVGHDPPALAAPARRPACAPLHRDQASACACEAQALLLPLASRRVAPPGAAVLTRAWGARSSRRRVAAHRCRRERGAVRLPVWQQRLWRWEPVWGVGMACGTRWHLLYRRCWAALMAATRASIPV